MGDPKRRRKKYATPKYPWSKEELDAELRLLGEYGLRNKHELWRHHAMLSKYRTMARESLAKPLDERAKLERQIINKLYSLGFVSENAALEDVLDLSIEDVLERRLQTLTLRHGLARTTQQARQLIVHGHVSIGGKRVTVPSYTVSRDEESVLAYTPTSPIANTRHLLRKEIAAISQKQEPPTETEVEEKEAQA